MTEHDLKCWPEFYRVLESGEKTFELRKDDRCFRVGDRLLLREWKRLGLAKDGEPVGEYTGRQLEKRVTYLLSGIGLEKDWVCMALGPVKRP